MLNALSVGKQVYLVTGYTDLRQSIDGLATIVQAQLRLDPNCSAKDDGFLLLCKRLNNGRFQWSRNETEALLLTPQQTRWLLEGLKIEQPKAIHEGKKSVLY